LRDLVGISVKEKKEEKIVILSKKEQKKKELEEMDKVLSEMGLTANTPVTTTISEVKAVEGKESKESQQEGEEKKKKKKKKKAAEGEQTEEAKVSETTVQAGDENKDKPQNPVDVEKAIQEAMKKRLKKEQGGQKKGLNLEAAKQEILDRKNQTKKKEKKNYEDG